MGMLWTLWIHYNNIAFTGNFSYSKRKRKQVCQGGLQEQKRGEAEVKKKIAEKSGYRGFELRENEVFVARHFWGKETVGEYGHSCVQKKKKRTRKQRYCCLLCVLLFALNVFSLTPMLKNNK